MKAAVITKTLMKLETESTEMSLGFRRYIVLPERVKKNIHIAHFIETGSVNWHRRTVDFLGGLTESEYVTYLKNA